MALVFIVLGATLILFALDKFRLEAVALAGLLVLFLGGALTLPQALSGFSDPLVIMIAGLFVVGAGLVETGAAGAVGRGLGRLAGTQPLRVTLILMAATGLLSAFLSSTGTVAVMLPIAVHLARRAGLSPRQVLMPLAFASSIGGMLTLIGTPPNLAAHDALVESGAAGFGFFAFTPIGLLMLVIGMASVALLRPLLLGGRPAPDPGALPTLSELLGAYGLPGTLFRVPIPPASEWIGQSLSALALRSEHRANVVAILHDGRVVHPSPSSRILAGDELIIRSRPEDLRLLVERGLIEEPQPCLDIPQPLRAVEVVLGGRSDLVHRTLRQSGFSDRTGLNILAIRRGGRPLAERTSQAGLEAGDSLLAVGPARAADEMARSLEHVLVSAAAEPAQAGMKPKAWIALAILGAMMVVLSFGWLPPAAAVLIAALLMASAGCLSSGAVYQSISWPTLILIASVLPVAEALKSTGGVDLMVKGLPGALGSSGPHAALGAIFALTALHSQVMSNTATAVLMAPVAISAAQAMGASPHPMAMAVAVAASCSFSTPVASPVNLLVLNAGEYSFRDFLKVGLPLQIAVFIAAVAAIPLLLPF